jgi:ribosomal protein S18 acetylase RimI-like enzyme
VSKNTEQGFENNPNIRIKRADNATEKKAAIIECEEAFDVVGGIDHEKIIEKICSYAEVQIAYEDGPVGYCAIYANDLNSKVGYITLIGVKKDYQGLGIGKRLLNAAIETAINQGMNRIKLEVYRENRDAINFYQKNGFEFTGEETERGLYMSKFVG